MNDIEIYNQPLHLYDAKEYAIEHGCSTPDDGAILYFKNEYPKGIDVDNDTSVYTYDKPIGKLVGHINNGDIYLVNGKNISYYCLVKNNFENEQSVKNTVKLNESQLRKIVAESVKKVLKEEGKQTISQDQAGILLLKSVDNNDFEDRIYEFAMELCDARIHAIESKYNIVGYDGLPYTDEEDICWYDDYRDDFLKAVFERIKEMM